MMKVTSNTANPANAGVTDQRAVRTFMAIYV